MNNIKIKLPYIIIFIGFNDPKIHKRGVDNIILLQSKALVGQRLFYIFFGPVTKVSKWGKITVISIRKFDFLSLNLVIRFLKRKYKAQPFIHSHNYQLSFFCLYSTNVFTVHDGLTYLYKRFNRKYIFLFRLIELGVYRRAKKVHFISNFTKSEALYDKKYDYKSVIIYNSTPLESLVQKTFNKDFKFIGKKGVLNIFCVRSIEERARIDLLIKVCLKLKEYSLPIVISVAGKGPLLDKYRNIIEKENIDNLFLLGYINDEELTNYYIECDIVMLPSEYGEGFGLPIIEGYLFGKPVIASNKCAIPEIIIDKKMLFENNVESIIDRIMWLIKNKEVLNDSLEYYKYYNKRFSQKQIISQYKDKIYHK